ncbi:hypothetical protein [Gordonia malaquae]|uniref:hypothetical protein n=1 Tax=Gordonia malaquae TaxID=410332 RepID=UPI0030FEA32A
MRVDLRLDPVGDYIADDGIVVAFVKDDVPFISFAGTDAVQHEAGYHGVPGPVLVVLHGCRKGWKKVTADAD